MIKNPYCKSKGSLFWVRKSEGEIIHLPGMELDLVHEYGTTTITLRSALPNNTDLFFGFQEGDGLCLLYKDYGPLEEFDKDQIVLTIGNCEVLRLEAKRLIDSQSDEVMSFELEIQGEIIENRL